MIKNWFYLVYLLNKGHINPFLNSALPLYTVMFVCSMCDEVLLTKQHIAVNHHSVICSPFLENNEFGLNISFYPQIL